MKKVLFAVFPLVTLFFTTEKVQSQTQLKIGVFDMDLMVQAMPGYKVVDSLLQGKRIFSLNSLISRLGISSSYPSILLRFVAIKQKTIWAKIKLFTCGILYLIARNNTLTAYDINMPFLFFNFGMLANGVLIFRVREFEEIHLSFYRSLSVSLMKRFLQYTFIYFTLFIPEIVILLILVPVHLHYQDALNFILCGFSLLLLMNSITFYYDFKMKDYLKILLAIFCVECIFFLTVGLGSLCLLLFIFAATIFLSRYYTFERNTE